MEFLLGACAAFYLDYNLGLERTVKKIQATDTGECLHSREGTGHKALARAFGANQHLGYQIALEVQFVEDFGGIGMGPDHSLIFGFSKFLCDIYSQSGTNVVKWGNWVKVCVYELLVNSYFALRASY